MVVDRGSDESVYEQIARQIRSRIATGELPSGFALPSVRTLASDLGLNLNTVARAYRLLEQDGFVAIRRRGGVRVAAPASRPEPQVRTRLHASLRGVLVLMRQAGLLPDEIRRLAAAEIQLLLREETRQE